MKQMWYHGTTEENANKILEEGFRAGTYFTWDLSSALVMGGDHVFEIFVDFETKDWQYRIKEVMPPSKIIRLCKYRPEVVYTNREAELDVKRENIKEHCPDKYETLEVCLTCNGEGQLDNYSRFDRWRDRDQCTICGACGGHGVVPNPMLEEN